MFVRARPFGALLVSIAAAALVAGCGSEGSEQEPRGDATPAAQSPSASSTSSTSSGSPVAGGEPAAEPDPPAELNFTARTLEGEEFSGASLAGKAAVLWFWAPWCPNCRAEAPTLADTAAANEGDVAFVGVASQSDTGAMRDFVRDYGVDGFRHLDDSGGEIWQRFGVTYQPAYAFVSPDGTVEVVKQQLSETELAERVGNLAAG
ncbi:protein disulfide oxidoreductase [Qaidamihabitans albus]|uniref:protein disulfide oxidoreductase n=1 Tax=Qaidamihabitans albus TaxID=2795733 RepID=UPI0018F21D82|nr:protein disulfide oxidoreductase [Qaidamihabitans albus]